MNFKFLTMLLMSSLLWMTACDRGEDDDDVVIPGIDIAVSGKITTNTTWTATNKYILTGFVYVEEGATLTIEPGTIIKGDKATKAALIIKPGAKIIADGTKAKPIVFTSNQPKGSRNYGDWGGLIILGKAIVNKTPATIEGENVSIFGGTNAADNSGVLRYVRIEFAGIALETDKEINGLTLGGVGSGTTIEYVQTSFIGDDGFEWFGGSVNPKFLISYKNVDDDFDTDWGYSGSVQYGLAFRDPKIADQCTCSKSNGFESDNDGTGTDAAPQTSCKFANISVIMGDGTPDAKFRSTLHIRRNSALSIYNSLSIGAFPGGLEFDGAATKKNFVDGKSDYLGLIFAGAAKPFVFDPLVAADVANETKLKEVSRKNIFGIDVTTLGLPAGYNAVTAKPGFLPSATSSLLTSGVALPAGFEANTVVGAFGKTDWTEGWANWDPQNTDY